MSPTTPLWHPCLRPYACHVTLHTSPACVPAAQLRFSIWRDLLAPLQIARIYVHAFPNSIDVVALSKCEPTLHHLLDLRAAMFA